MQTLLAIRLLEFLEQLLHAPVVLLVLAFVLVRAMTCPLSVSIGLRIAARD